MIGIEEFYCEGCLWRLRPSDVVSLLLPEMPRGDEAPVAFAHIGHEPPGYRPTDSGILAILHHRVRAQGRLRTARRTLAAAACRLTSRAGSRNS